MASEDTDRLFDDLYEATRPHALKVARSVLLATMAVWLGLAQRHADYSSFAVFVIVFVLSIINRYHWVAGLVITWLIALYFATPEMVAGWKSMRGG